MKRLIIVVVMLIVQMTQLSAVKPSKRKVGIYVGTRVQPTGFID